MIRHPQGAAPELLLKLSNATYIDPIEYTDWLRRNRFTLSDGFYQCGESESHPEVENCLHIWLRQQFLAQRSLNSRPALAASQPEPSLTKTRSAEPVGILGRLIRRRS